MSWNRPTETKAHPCVKSNKRKCLFALGIIALALGCLLALLFGSNQNCKDTAKDSVSKVAGVGKLAGGSKAKFVAQRKSERTASVEKPELAEAAKILGTEKKGRVVTFRKPEGRIFDNEFENFVMDIVTCIPGERFIEVPLDETFDEMFKVSLTNKIVILDTDSEETKEIKQAVIDAKDEVRREMDAGRRPSEVVAESRRELNKIADYRDQLQKAFDQLALEAKTPQEIIDYCNEANEILKEYGSFPIEGATTEQEALDLQEYLIENKRQEEELEAKNEASKKESK